MAENDTGNGDTEKFSEEILYWAKKYAEENGWRVNPDEKQLSAVVRGLARNTIRFGERYCPCRIRSGDLKKDKEIVCPCIFHRDEIETDGSCHCHFFFK